jgi:zinc protease
LFDSRTPVLVVPPVHDDYLPLLVTNSRLDGSFGSRTTSTIRQNKGYTYSPFCPVQDKKGGSVWYEAADVTSEPTVDALLDIEKEIKRLQMEPPSKAERQGIQNSGVDLCASQIIARRHSRQVEFSGPFSFR